MEPDRGGRLPPPVTIRPYRDGDFPAVTLLEGGGLHEPYRSAVFVRQMGEVCRETFLVAEDENGEPSGYCVGAVLQQDPYEAWILRLGVRDGQRRRGIGTALVRAVTAALAARGVRTIRLSVSPSNNGAIRIYEREGFCRERVATGYFGNGEDRIIMRRELSQKGG